MLMLLAAAGTAAIYGVLVLHRMGADPSLADILRRLPEKNAVTIHVDLAAIRAAGMASVLEGAAVAEEPDYRRFVAESGFDWKRDLDAVTATKAGGDWYFFVRGRFDMEKLRGFALARNGICKNGVCDVAGATPGRRVSFYPMTATMLVLATSKSTQAVYSVSEKKRTEWAGGVPEGPAWVSFNGSVLAGDPALPSGGRLFGKVLSETDRTSFSVTGGTGGLELKMRAICPSADGAGNVKAQLEGVTKEFKGYFERVGQASSPGDLSGLLLSGQFASAGNEVTGRWPISVALLQKLAGGEL
jgi:hypothetical protein